MIFAAVLLSVFLIIIDIPSTIISLIFGFDIYDIPSGVYLMLQFFLYLCYIIGLAWIIHTIITGISNFIDIPYKKETIQIGVLAVLFVYVYEIFTLLLSNSISSILYMIGI